VILAWCLIVTKRQITILKMIDYIQHVLKIEEIKKEHDKLMMAKIIKYENEIAELKKDNKKLAEQVNDKANLVGKLRDKGLI